jgi:hypothetical protein
MHDTIDKTKDWLEGQRKIKYLKECMERKTYIHKESLQEER